MAAARKCKITFVAEAKRNKRIRPRVHWWGKIWAYVVFSRVGPQAGERKHSRIAVGRIAFSTDEILSRRRYREILSVRPTKSAFILRAVAAMEHSPRTWVSICTIISPIMLITYFPHHEDSGAN